MSDKEKNTKDLDKTENTEYLDNSPAEDKQDAEKASESEKPRAEETAKKKKPAKKTAKRTPKKEAADTKADTDSVGIFEEHPKEEVQDDCKIDPIPEEDTAPRSSDDKETDSSFDNTCEEESAEASPEASEACVSIETAEIEAGEDEPNSEHRLNEDAEDGEIILPPDKIFSVPIKKKEEEEDEPEAAAECIDDDGQYRFAEIPQEPHEADEEEALELDYSEPAQDKYNEKKPRKIDGRFDFIELFVFTFLAVIIVTSFLFRHSVVEGESMENTLYSGEHLIISDLFYTPKRGDVIVCEDYTTALRKPIVKRVIGIEGDVIQITEYPRACIVTVNGRPIDETAYLNIDGDLTDGTGAIRVYEPITVGKDELFVMGDHRNMSTDSRMIGTVSEDSVLGKVLLRFYPFDKFGTVD